MTFGIIDDATDARVEPIRHERRESTGDAVNRLHRKPYHYQQKGENRHSMPGNKQKSKKKDEQKKDGRRERGDGGRGQQAASGASTADKDEQKKAPREGSNFTVPLC